MTPTRFIEAFQHNTKYTGWQMPTANPDIARSPTPSAKSSGFHSIMLEYPELPPTPFALGFTTEIKSNPEEVIAPIVPVAVPDADRDSDCEIIEPSVDIIFLPSVPAHVDPGAIENLIINPKMD